MPLAITPQVIYETTTVSDPAISPDGTRVAFVQSRLDGDRDKVLSQIMMMAPGDGEPYPVTQGETDKRPRFSPDGQTLAFIRPDLNGRNQLLLAPVGLGEAVRLTDEVGGAGDHSWSPDSRHLAFVSSVDPDREGDGGLTPVRAATRIRYRSGADVWRGNAYDQLFVVDTQTSDTRQLTTGDGDDGSPIWTPDGERIAFMADRRDDRDITLGTEAYVIPSKGGEPQEWSQGLFRVNAFAWSLDGNRLVVAGSDDREVDDPRQSWLFVIEPGRPPRRITDGSFTPVLGDAEIRWTDDGRIVFVGDSRGQSYLCEVPEAGGTLKTVTGGGVQTRAMTLDAEARKAVVLSTPPDAMADLHLVDLDASVQTRLTAVNREYFDTHPPGRMQKFTMSRAGMEVESRLVTPPDFDPSRKYPMVVDIHGGPAGRWMDSFDSAPAGSPHQHVLATAGYLVLAVNCRGSSSYGPEFLKGVIKDWGGEDYLDIMAAVDEMCGRSYVDETRLGVQGYSYGGYMSAWIIGHDDRFAAAMVGAPVLNLWSWYGTGYDGVTFTETHFGGPPWETMDDLIERSPQAYVDRVDTPVLLLHGEADIDAPLEQSEQYFVALKRLGKQVEFVQLPGCGHTFLNGGPPRMRVEYVRRLLDWYDKHLGRE